MVFSLQRRVLWVNLTLRWLWEALEGRRSEVVESEAQSETRTAALRVCGAGVETECWLDMCIILVYYSETDRFRLRYGC